MMGSGRARWRKKKNEKERKERRDRQLDGHIERKDGRENGAERKKT